MPGQHVVADVKVLHHAVDSFERRQLLHVAAPRPRTKATLSPPPVGLALGWGRIVVEGWVGGLYTNMGVRHST
jgi:hypothetical protein